MTVIVWDKTAIAKFVKRYNVGLTISNLNNIDKLIESVSSQQYEALQKNVTRIAKKMRKGYYLITAVNKLIIKMNQI